MSHFLRVLCVSTVLVLVGWTPARQSEPPRFEPVECWFELPQDADVTCGTVAVPADRARFAGPEHTLRLAVAILHAPGGDPAADPLFFLQGGPGASGVRTLFGDDAGWAMLAPLAQARYLVAIDQRGTGYSRPSLDCHPGEALPDCRARLVRMGIDLADYQSAANAADINDIRLALGYDQVNLLGGSYGTRLALTLLRDFPGGLRSVILDSVVPLQVHLDTSFNETFVPALDQLFTACAADAACGAAYPDLETRFYDLMQRLNRAPVVVDAAGDEVWIGGVQFAGLMRQALYFNEALPYLPRLIHHTAGGDLVPLAEMIRELPSGDFSEGMMLSVWCAEETLFLTEAEAAAEIAALPRALRDYAAAEVNRFAEACRVWGVPRAPDFEESAVAGDVPVLLLTGQFDPVTRLPWAQLAAETLSRSYVYEIPAQGHGAMRGECARAIIEQFLAAPDVEPDAGCIAGIAPPVWFVEE